MAVYSSENPIKSAKSRGREAISTSGIRFPNGAMLEQVKDPQTGEIALIYLTVDGNDCKAGIGNLHEIDGKFYAPIVDSIVKTDTVLFPSKIADFKSIKELRHEIQKFVHQYVDVSEYFERLASYYVLLSWVYDAFSVVPYLRVIGEAGCGKSRFLSVMRAICYKSMRVSGAISTASIFRIIEQFAGTLIMDEADLPSKSDEYAAAVKILNCGYERDNPVLRQEKVKDNYESKAYRVFGCKVIASRKRFEDRALESRCITERMTKMQRREEIPLVLPSYFDEHALRLRNQLLAYRFRMLYDWKDPLTIYAQHGIEPRISQITSSLLAIINDRAEQEQLKAWAKDYTESMIVDRGSSTEGDVVKALFELMESGGELTVGNITAKTNEPYESVNDKLSTRRVGYILGFLGLVKQKAKGRYIIDTRRSQKTLELLAKQYGIDEANLKLNGGH